MKEKNKGIIIMLLGLIVLLGIGIYSAYSYEPAQDGYFMVMIDEEQFYLFYGTEYEQYCHNEYGCILTGRVRKE
jgi:hypothetical protein